MPKAPGIPKNNDNCQIYKSRTNINDVVFTLSGDLKIKYDLRYKTFFQLYFLVKVF